MAIKRIAAYLLTAAIITCLLLTLGGCGASLRPGATPAPESQTLAPAPLNGLPTPQAALKAGSAEPGSRFIQGNHYISEPGFFANVSLKAYFGTVSLVPKGDGGFTDLAYTIYRYALPDYQDAPMVRLSLSTDNDALARCWLGMANYERGTWDWFRPALDGTLAFDSLAPYFTAQGDMHVVVALTGTDPATVGWVVVGGNIPPNAFIGGTPQEGAAPLAVSLRAVNAQADVDGYVALFEWDLNGDGIYDQSGAALDDIDFTCTTPGTYPATLRVTDDAGASSTDTMVIVVQ